MVKLTAPYNFVPLNKEVYIPSWAEKVSQDIPFEDGEDGWIEVTWKNVSPLIVRNASTKEDSSPVYVEAGGKKLYFIPGTSMKGMLRSTLEILSFGKMEQYGNRFFGHREFNTKQPEGKAYRDEMNNVKWGWLRKDDDDLFLSPCSSDVKQIQISDLKKKYRDYDSETSQWERNKYIAKRNNGGMFPEIEDGYRLYCTGKMHNKKHELLIPTATEEEEKLTDNMRDEFLTVHAQTPDFEKFIDLLDKGQNIPVSYIKKDGELVAIGLSRMLKLPYTTDVRTLVKNEQEMVKGKDLCETIFGFIGKTSKDESLRGRVQVSHAFIDEPDGRELLDEVPGVLGEPKPSFYPLYLKQTKSPYKTYNNAEGIAGRKPYRVHTKESVLPLPGGNENDNVKTHFRPLRPGLSFVMRINLHNMRPIEIGAILSALTLHNTKDAWHNLGGAKSFGYGKMECVKVEIKGLKHQEKEEYMRAFEEEMEIFTRGKLGQKWIETEQVKALVNILSEHSNADVRMMTLDEYGRVSKEPFQKLNEGNRGLTSLLSEDFDKEYKKKRFVDEHKGEYEEAERLKQEGNLSEAINVYNELIKQLDIEGLSTEEEEENINRIKAAIEEKKKKDEEESKKAEEEAREQRLAQGLAAQLEAKYEDGRFKRDTVKKALDVTGTWLKQNNRKELTDDEKEYLLSTLKRLKSTQHGDDRNLWNGRDKRGWDRIKALIGEDLTEQLKS